MPVHAYGPVITGRLSVLKHQASCSALAAGLLKLVQPSAIISHIPASEKSVVIVTGIVYHCYHNLALYVYACIVVPAVLRSVYAKAAEDIFRLWNLHLVRSPGSPYHQVFRIKQVSLLFAAHAHLASYGLGGYGYHLEGLEPAAAKGGLKAQFLQLSGKVINGNAFIFRHWLSPAELVRSNGLDPLPEQLLVIRTCRCRHLGGRLPANKQGCQ